MSRVSTHRLLSAGGIGPLSRLLLRSRTVVLSSWNERFPSSGGMGPLSLFPERFSLLR